MGSNPAIPTNQIISDGPAASAGPFCCRQKISEQCRLRANEAAEGWIPRSRASELPAAAAVPQLERCRALTARKRCAMMVRGTRNSSPTR